MYNLNTLKVSLVQQNIIWEDKRQNLSNLDSLFKNIIDTDLIVLPELFSTGFSMNVEALSEKMNGDIFCWMKEKAKKINCYFLGSVIIEENQFFYNRILVFDPVGEVSFYDKRHLFSIGDEDKYFKKGNKKLIFKINEWRICPLICYDLRFPVWSRNNNDYDLLIYIANWPASRLNVWDNLLISRAIENQCYTIGVNRVGSDGNNLKYKGGSCVIAPKGNKQFMAPDNEDSINTETLDLKSLRDFRNKFPVLKDKDTFSIDN